MKSIVKKNLEEIFHIMNDNFTVNKPQEVLEHYYTKINKYIDNVRDYMANNKVSPVDSQIINYNLELIMGCSDLKKALEILKKELQKDLNKEVLDKIESQIKQLKEIVIRININCLFNDSIAKFITSTDLDLMLLEIVVKNKREALNSK